MTRETVVVDRVADAIRREQFRHTIYGSGDGDLPIVPWSEMNSRAKKLWRKLAHVALAALPTEPEVAARVEGEA